MTNVLIVDDDIVARVLARHIVVSSGWQPIEASNGAEALKLFSDNDIDVVMCDQQMPGMSGLDVCSELRKISSVPFILLTGHAAEDELDMAGNMIDSFVTKPASSAELTQTISAALEKSTPRLG